MRRLFFLLSALASALCPAADAGPSFAEARPLLEGACFACHGPTKKKSGIDLSAYADEAAVARDRKTWRRVAEQLESGEMPPEEAKVQPSAAQRAQLLAAVRRALVQADAALARIRDPGPSPLRRLNRVEYTRTVKDLLGVGGDLAEAVGLPDDGERGYATYAGALTMPPLLFEKYYAAADQALATLVEPGAEARPEARATWDAVFVAKPGPTPAARKDAARAVLAAFARRAYRRPVQPDELARLCRLYDAAEAKGRDFAAAVKLALKGVLVSPNFLCRVEADRAPHGSAEPYRIGDHELAVRLSYLLWSTMPDRELGELADRGRLADPATCDAQARRLLADPRARALTEGFAASWLQVDHLDKARPTQQNFPAFTASLRQAMRDETLMFVDQLRERDGSLLDLLDSDYTFVNEELARHYGLSGAGTISGAQLRRVALKPGDHRGGVLGMGSVLTMTSHTFRTSPTLRGKWVLEVLLGTPPPPPPPNVDQAIDEHAKQAGAAKTFREQLARHVSDAACASCHRKMDPLGFALDNYDGIGAWREGTTERPLDVSGRLPGGETFAGVAGLKQVLWAKRERFVRTLVEQFFVYALGRDLIPADEKPVQDVVDQLAKDGYRFSTLVLGVTRSFPFQFRRNPDAALADQARANLSVGSP
jgi:hypothetical protein